MAQLVELFQGEPIVSFAVLLAIILIVPPCFERLRLPGLLGLLVAGVALGPTGLNLLRSESEALVLLSDIGLVYLMFVAGLEIDLEQFHQTRNRSVGFGGLTFIVPLLTGTLIGLVFQFGLNSAILLGSLLASHTLLAYPILSRLGVVRNEAVTVTIGATIFTDIGALLVLAICVGVHGGDFTPLRLFILLGGLLIYSIAILFGLSWLGKEFFRRSGDEEGNQFLFILLALFLAAVGAEVIGVEKIVGAFLAGLAINDIVGDSPVKEKVVFVGTVLFIPIFFVDLGLLIDLTAFISSLAAIWLTLTIISGLLLSKYIAALLAASLYRYSWREQLTMWSLSVPQVAATLAATLVGYRAGLLSEDVLNGVIVMMVVTSTVGPIITTRAASGLEVSAIAPPASASITPSQIAPIHPEALQPFTVVVPVYNPKTERHLIEMAALLVRHEGGRIVPLAITMGHVHMDDPHLNAGLRRSQRLLNRAMKVSDQLEVQADPLLRIDDSIAQGISRASREQQASLVLMGWSKTTGLRARLFGNVIDSVLWASHCPIAVTRLLKSPKEIQQILVPLENVTQQAVSMVRFANGIAAANQAQITLLHICTPATTTNHIAWVESQIHLLAQKYLSTQSPRIQVITADDMVSATLAIATDYDLVVLRSLRRRLNLNELAISDVTTQLIQQLNCSVVMLGEPPRNTHTSPASATPGDRETAAS